MWGYTCSTGFSLGKYTADTFGSAKGTPVSSQNPRISELPRHRTANVGTFYRWGFAPRHKNQIISGPDFFCQHTECFPDHTARTASFHSVPNFLTCGDPHAEIAGTVFQHIRHKTWRNKGSPFCVHTAEILIFADRTKNIHKNHPASASTAERRIFYAKTAVSIETAG